MLIRKEKEKRGRIDRVLCKNEILLIVWLMYVW